MFKELDKLVKEGYLRKFEDGDLVGYNYTDKCTFERKWNKYTLNNRGSVYNKVTGKKIAATFPKFFNLGELSASQQRAIVNGSGVYRNYECFEKIDGSLGIIYHDGEKWRVNTRGSFSSDQAIKATEMLKKYHFDMPVSTDLTYLVEIIYPENKIIVNYGDLEELRLIGIMNRETGKELPWRDCIHFARTLGLPLAEKFILTVDEMLKLQKEIPKDEEGFVIKFGNGFRVKIKGEEYMKLARIISQLAPLALWEKMSEGIVDEGFLATIPEEFYDEVDKICFTLEKRYGIIQQEINNEVMYVRSKFAEFSGGEFFKRVGLYVQDPRNNIKHPNCIFAVLRGVSVGEYVMKKIRPKGNSLEIK